VLAVLAVLVGVLAVTLVSLQTAFRLIDARGEPEMGSERTPDGTER
jgi:hypothetical protein